MTAAPKPVHRIRRVPKNASYDRASVDAVLDASMIAHISFIEDDRPFCIPMLHARVGDDLLIHGSTASRLMRTLGGGAPACVSITTVTGLVLARSVFDHSANYEAVVLHGAFGVVRDPDARLAGYEAFTEKLLPGRWPEVRPPSVQELKATQILAMPIGGSVSVKRRTGGPSDDASEDAATLDTWAGEIPIVTSFGEPVASPGLRPGIALSPSVLALVA